MVISVGIKVKFKAYSLYKYKKKLIFETIVKTSLMCVMFKMKYLKNNIKLNYN